MTTTPSAERELFEATFADKSSVERHPLRPNEYAYQNVNEYWSIWQAARATPPAQVQESDRCQHGDYAKTCQYCLAQLLAPPALREATQHPCANGRCDYAHAVGMEKEHCSAGNCQHDIYASNTAPALRVAPTEQEPYAWYVTKAKSAGRGVLSIGSKPPVLWEDEAIPLYTWPQPVSQSPAVQGVPAGWISVTKKKPTLHERVLIIAPDADDDPITAIATFNAKDMFIADGGRALKRIKYWQPLPLPAAPQLGEQNG